MRKCSLHECLLLCLLLLLYLEFTITLIFTGLLCEILYLENDTEFNLNPDNSCSKYLILESEILHFT
jgi:hypothetical protein